jgi:phosphoglucomutase/phosphomannomutase
MSNQSSDELEQSLNAIRIAVERGQLTDSAAENLNRWLRESYYAEYRQALHRLVSQSNFDELDRLFWERIPFGTGGRRGPMADFGSATINARTIAESAYGLGEYVKRFRNRLTDSRQSSPPHAVVAFDSRHRSLEFAQGTATVLAASGFLVFLFSEPRSTPELSFAVRYLQCDAGVMISASHNPPTDNGFKAYWSNGGQVLPPHDAGIIACVDAATEITKLNFHEGVRNGRIVLLGPTVDSAYVDAVCALSLSSERAVRALYTPLHGVGESSVFRVIRQLGFEGVTIFEAQRSLDGDFPNVPDHLPNPERSEVFIPAIQEAELIDAELILASDPDADRLAVAVRDATGHFVILSGNQLGALLTDYVLSRRALQGSMTPEHFVVETLVTTPLIQAIATDYGLAIVSDVLVGFKHIAAEVDARGVERFVFAAEESIGFMAGDYCRDKDGAIGAIYVLELAAQLKRQNRTLLDQLCVLHSKYGFHYELTRSITCTGSTGRRRIEHLMHRLRDQPPRSVGCCRFESVRDFLRGETRQLPSNEKSESRNHPSGDMLMFEGVSGDHCLTIAIRPSGTEPKLKLYGFIRTSPDRSSLANQEQARSSLTDVMIEMESWLLTDHGMAEASDQRRL